MTVVSDGPLPLGPPKGTFTGASDDDIKKMLTDNFLSPDNIVLEQNSPIVNMGDKLVLFDTGMGTSQAFGPTTGRQQKSMAEAGIKPEDIDAVVFSHAHIDHIGGVVDSSGKVLFPNAQFYIAQSDFDYWTDEGKLGSPLKDFVIHARKNLMPIRDKLVFYKDGQEFLPGIQALAAPGHTVGHTMFLVTSDGKSFAFLGDLTHHQILLMEHPRMEFSYDTDPKQAAEVARKNAGHAGGQQDPGDVVSLPVAGLWPCREDRRGIPLSPRADADVALRGWRRGWANGRPPAPGSNSCDVIVTIRCTFQLHRGFAFRTMAALASKWKHMATEKQYAFFQSLYSEESQRAGVLGDHAKNNLSLATFYSAFILFVVEKPGPAITSYGKWTFIAAVVCMLGAFLLSLWATQISIYEAIAEPADVIASYEDNPPTDDDFFDDRIADYAVAYEKNSLVNDRKANELLVARYFLLAGITLHATYFIIRFS